VVEAIAIQIISVFVFTMPDKLSEWMLKYQHDFQEANPKSIPCSSSNASSSSMIATVSHPFALLVAKRQLINIVGATGSNGGKKRTFGVRGYRQQARLQSSKLFRH
jgi:hypothetical protein